MCPGPDCGTVSAQWEGQSFNTWPQNKQLWLRALPFPGAQAAPRQACRAYPAGNAGPCQCSPAKRTLRRACHQSYSRRGVFPALADSRRVGRCAGGLQAPGPGPGCGLRATPLAPLPEQGFVVCALGVRGLFGTGSKLMQNTVKALSCELLRRGHGGL